MKIFTQIILIFLAITSCTEKSFHVESELENGNNEVIYFMLADTTINDVNFKRKFKIKFDRNRDTLRKGVFINEMAFGKHYFYENNQILAERDYVIPTPYFVDFCNTSEVIDFNDYQIKTDSSYLNSARFFNKNGDLISNKSDFYSKKVNYAKWKAEDSLIVEFQFYFNNYDIIQTELYFMVPEDTSLITMAKDTNNTYVFKRKVTYKNDYEIKGIVNIIALTKNQPEGDSTSYVQRPMFINEKIKFE